MMRKIFNCFAVGWFLCGISYFISTFVYGMFFTDKIQARVNTLEQVYRNEFSDNQTLFLIKKCDYSRGGYRVYLDIKNESNLSYDDLVTKIKELKEKNKWITEEEHEYQEYYYFHYRTRDDNYGFKIMVNKEKRKDIAMLVRIYFNDFYHQYAF